jgi:hypothetical protein
LGGFGSKGAIFSHCASVSNGPDRAIHPPSALLTLLISHFQKLNQHDFNGLSTVVQQLLVNWALAPEEASRFRATPFMRQAPANPLAGKNPPPRKVPST